VSRHAAIHPTAIVEVGATIGEESRIGAYTIIGPEVRIGRNCEVGPHASVTGRTEIGDDNRIYPFASIGTEPQDLKFAGEPTSLVIGARNTIRESVTINRGTADGGGVTRIGDDNLFMAFSHVAHDCKVGSRVVMANCASPAGHVVLGDGAIVGGLVGIHQHTRIGDLAFLGGGAMVTLDVPPFCVAVGDRAKLQGINVVGIKRAGLSEQEIRDVRAAYRILFQSGLRLQDAIDRLKDEYVESAAVAKMVAFIEGSTRGVCR
jgi:UDP-N-acetylglucosamine acyltransferase